MMQKDLDGYSILPLIVKKTSVRCMDCNAEVSAKVLRLKSHREKVPYARQNSVFFNKLSFKTDLISHSTAKMSTMNL